MQQGCRDPAACPWTLLGSVHLGPVLLPCTALSVLCPDGRAPSTEMQLYADHTKSSAGSSSILFCARRELHVRVRPA